MTPPAPDDAEYEAETRTAFAFANKIMSSLADDLGSGAVDVYAITRAFHICLCASLVEAAGVRLSDLRTLVALINKMTGPSCEEMFTLKLSGLDPLNKRPI
jgi:hypothetical protein